MMQRGEKTCDKCIFNCDCRIRMTIDNALDIFKEYFEKAQVQQTSIYSEIHNILASRCIYYRE